MRALVQRVQRCSVVINGNVQSSVGAGLLILLGVRNGDAVTDAEYLAERCAALRIFEDAEGKMNLSIKDVNGEAMVVSQFTLYGDTKKGNRPSYGDAAPSKIAEALYEHFIECLRKFLGDQKVGTGVFGATMDVELVNAGPVTLMVESRKQAPGQ
jgi:D-tyrosyl-tRNA(Tyr) deacylase